MSTSQAVNGCCDTYLETVCWDDGATTGRAFAISRADTGAVEYVDVVTGDFVPGATIVTCDDELSPTLSPTLIGRSEVVAAGNVPADKESVTFTNVGTTNGSVFGVPLHPGESVSFDSYYNPVAKTYRRLPLIAYVASATAILHISWVD